MENSRPETPDPELPTARPRRKVLMVNKLRWPWVGGVERVAEQMFAGLPTAFPIDMTYLHISPTNRVRDHRLSDHQRVVEVPNFFWSAFRKTLIGRMPWSFRFFSELQRLAWEHDLIYFHLPFPLATVAWQFAGVKKPYMLTWHSDIRRFPLVMKFYRPLQQRFLAGALGIVITSPQMLAYSADLRPWAGKTVVVPLGVPLHRFAGTSHSALSLLQDLSIAPGKYFLCVGRLAAYKGYDVLVEALKGRDGEPVLIVGSGPLEHELKKLSWIHRLEKRIHWLGERSDDEVVSLMQHCRALIMPSVDEAEAYGIVQVEAMACGKPVISTALKSGVPFVNQHEVSGLIVGPRDAKALFQAMLRLQEDAALCGRLGEGARARAHTTFSEELMLEKLGKCICGAVG